MNVTVNGVTYSGDYHSGSPNTATIAIPRSLKGRTGTITATTSNAAADVFYDPVSPTITIGADATATVAVKDGTTTISVNVIIDMSDGYVDEPIVKDVGWFKFRRRELNVTYVNNGVTLPGPRIKEVIAVQAKGVVGFEFNYATQKIVLYKTNSSQCDAKDMELAVLCILE